MKWLTLRNGLMAAIVLVALLLVWAYFSTRRKVLDASNDRYAEGAFDALNPNVPGVGVPS